MNDLIEFLTSKEIVIVYIIAGVLLIASFVYYLVEKNNSKRRMRNNTRELNKLVEEIKEQMPVEEKPIYNEPILQVVNEKSGVQELLESTKELTPTTMKVESPLRDEVVVEPLSTETKVEEPVINNVEIIKPELIVNKDNDKYTVEEPVLEYTTIEPDPQTARIELQKITEELRRQEELEQQEEKQEKQEVEQVNIELTDYEKEQEENAIISLQELVSKSKDLYLQNELSQYSDEGNEPISLNELENNRMNNKEYEEPFIIENVVPQEELIEPEKETVIENNTIHIDDMNTIKTEVPTDNKKFQSSPIISPIYGIEAQVSTSNIELENTADYDKLDAEIKKTNEFLMTLKELQKKLD